MSFLRCSSEPRTALNEVKGSAILKIHNILSAYSFASRAPQAHPENARN